MISLKHSFYYNFKNALDHDSELAHSLIEDEVAKMCTYDTQGVKEALIDAGVDVHGVKSPRKLGRIVRNNMENPEVRKRLVVLIMHNNPEFAKREKIVMGKAHRTGQAKYKRDMKIYRNKMSEVMYSADGDNIDEKIKLHSGNKKVLFGRRMTVGGVVALTATITSLVWVLGILVIRHYNKKKTPEFEPQPEVPPQPQEPPKPFMTEPTYGTQ